METPMEKREANSDRKRNRQKKKPARIFQKTKYGNLPKI
jgi:hypothetical protein